MTIDVNRMALHANRIDSKYSGAKVTREALPCAHSYPTDERFSHME